MKSHTIVLLVLAVTFVLFGCTGSGSTSASGSSSTPSSAATASSGTSTDLSSCMNQCPSSGATAVLCAQSCYSNSAKAAKDASICDPLQNQYNATLSYEVCLSGVAAVLDSAVPCTRITTDSQIEITCIDEAATEANDPNLCSSINFAPSAEYANPYENTSTYDSGAQSDCVQQVSQSGSSQ